MSTSCNNGITIPTLTVDPCGGETKSAKCIIYEQAISYLELAPNSTLEQVIEKLMISLIDARNRITTLENP